MRLIFDLDGTIIDSSHRQLTRPDGSLDLAHWVENSTAEKVAADTLLPLADIWRKSWAGKQEIIVCTARVMADADYEFLMDHGLNCHAVLSRPEECRIQDHILKEVQIRLYAQSKDMNWRVFCRNTLMIDDNQNVLKHMRGCGLTCEDAKDWNQVLARSKTA